MDPKNDRIRGAYFQSIPSVLSICNLCFIFTCLEMNYYRSYILIFFAAILLPSCAPQQTDLIYRSTEKKPRNVILLIADGMGSGQLTGSMFFKKKDKLINRFPVVGFKKTSASDDLITDSAASGTAMSCGIKTYVGAIGVDQDTIPVQNMIEKMSQSKKATGLVVSSSIVHGTPASFYAHRSTRLDLEGIAEDLVTASPDLFIGGGKYYFSARRDGQDLIDKLCEKGYQVHSFFNEEISITNPNPKHKFAFFTAEREPLSANLKRRYLPLAVNKAIKYLSKRSDNGFFLMVEASQVDWACHNKNADWLSAELKDFRSTLYEILRFANKDGNTLVIVTGDHETGGVSVEGKSSLGAVKFVFGSNDHTGEMVPVLAMGPGANLFSGIYENTEIHNKIMQLINGQ